MATRSMPFWPRPATTSGSSWPGSGLCAPFSGRLSWSGITRAAPPPHPPERPNSLFHRRLSILLLLKVPPIRTAFALVNNAVDAVASATRAGTSFVFGYLGGGPLPFELKTPGSEFILAFQALPMALVMSVLTTVLFHWRILPPVIRGFSWVLQRTLGVGGAVGLSTAANIFVGMVEAPLFIRPYLAQLTRSELFVVMTGGMAGIAGTVLVLYATILRNVIPDVAGHLLVASVLAAPVAILIARLMVPETSGARTDG